MNVYPQLHAAVAHLITGYHEDLTKYDKEAIEKSQGLPFLHFTRELGTHIVFLLPHDHPDLPTAGVLVPYLFGQADREHILKQIAEVTKYCAEKSTVLIAHYFDGKNLEVITSSDAIRIANEHVYSVRQAWHPLQAAA